MSEAITPIQWGAHKAELLERSLRCFGAGLGGLVPLLGASSAVWALVEYRRLNRSEWRTWNAARPYLVAGAIFAAVGLAVSTVVVLVVIKLALDASQLGPGF